MAEKRIRTDKLSKEWAYANLCWNAIVSGKPIPPIPQCCVYETVDGGKERFVAFRGISPKQVTHGGVTWYQMKD